MLEILCLYPGPRSKRKLRINKVAFGVDQQAENKQTKQQQNAQSHQMLYVSRARSDPPPAHPQMDRSQSMSADCKIAARLFHFCLDKAAVLRFRSRSN